MPLIVIGIIFPPLFLLVMIQYGAITFPYWDHVNTANYIIQYFDGTLTFQSLIEANVQARPLFPRLIFVLNAALTNWDVRSEFTYIYLTVYGALAALLFALWRLSKGWPPIPILAAAALISVIACSPVGSHNHYWSLMLIATLANLCAIVTLLLISMQPLSWRANILAAILAWVSAYSNNQGLFLFPAIFIVHQIFSTKIFSFNRRSLFWLINLIVCYAVYIPGAWDGDTPPPGLFNFLAFILVYAGNPLGSLLWFPYHGAIDLPYTTIINAISGIVTLGFVGFAAWRTFWELPTKRPESLILFSFALYAGACTVVTAWGRANGTYAIESANSSRYSIFAACFLFGLIFYYTAKFAKGDIAVTRWHKAALAFFLTASAISYARSVPVYRTTHNDNEWLADAYAPHAAPTDLDIRVFPDVAKFQNVKADLHRLGIGPYRLIAKTTQAISSSRYVAAIALGSGAEIKQRFYSAYPNIRSISFEVVTYARWPSAYRVHWNIAAMRNGNRSTVGDGSFSTFFLSDWQTITLGLNAANSKSQEEYEVTFFVEPGEAIRQPIGLPLYAPGDQGSSPALVDGVARNDGSMARLSVKYDHE